MYALTLNISYTYTIFCIHIYYTYNCTYVHINTDTHMHTCMHVKSIGYTQIYNTCIHIHICTYKYIYCISAHTPIHAYYIHTNIYLIHTGAIHVHTHRCTYIHILINMHVHIHRYICTHTQIHRYTCTHTANCLLESLSRGLSLTVDLRSPREDSSVLNRNLAWVMIQHCKSVVGILQHWDREYHFLAVNTPSVPFDSPRWKIHCLYAPLRAPPPNILVRSSTLSAKLYSSGWRENEDHVNW